jgi:AAA domain
VIVADPGAGKTMGIRDLIKTAGKRSILAVVAPKNNEDEQALGDQFFTALGLPLRGHWRTRKPKLIGHLHQYGTECLIVDDAHDLSLEHLMFIKEVTDQGRLQYDHPLGLCLVAAGRGNTIPLKETLDQPDPTWLQFRRRLDKLAPFCQIAGHASEEVRDILATLETVYQPLFPQLNLRQWAGSIYTWLTQPVLDPTHSGRVTMDNLMKLVTTALEWSYEAKDSDVKVERLKLAAATKCTFSGMVIPIELQQFQESSTRLVECPDCGAMRTLEPRGGVLRFKSHDRRKTTTPNTGQRWARGKTDWDVVNG